MIEYQKAKDEGTKYDKRINEMQKELSGSKYKPQISSNAFANKLSEWDQSQIIFGRKFSANIENKLSNTVVHQNDSTVANATIVTPSKGYVSTWNGYDIEHISNHWSPFRENNNNLRGEEFKEYENRQTFYQNINPVQNNKITKINNLFSTK